MDANEIISFIANSKKATPVKVYIKGELTGVEFGSTAKTFINGNTGIVFGEWAEISPVLMVKEKIYESAVNALQNKKAKSVPVLVHP